MLWQSRRATSCRSEAIRSNSFLHLPRYELLNHAQRKMKDEILSVIRQTNPNYPEMDYDDDVFKYIVQFNDEYCIDAFAKGISFALNFKEQAERFMNKKYDY